MSARASGSLSAGWPPNDRAAVVNVLDASSQAAARAVTRDCDPGWVGPKLIDVVEQPELPA
jgi:hypothetical protein